MQLKRARKARQDGVETREAILAAAEQEFADKGTVVFRNNDVTVTPGGGEFLTHWSKVSTKNYRFDRLDVQNNVFRGVKTERDFFKNVTNTGKRTLRSNTITR